MTLVKAKKRQTTNMRRVKGDHHRKNSKYTKTYWPYLPIVLILGGSFIANQYLPTSIGAAYSTRAGAVFSSNNNLIVDAIYLILSALIIWYAVRHYKRIKTLIIGGEHLLAKHYVLDVVAAIFIGGLYILVR